MQAVTSMVKGGSLAQPSPCLAGAPHRLPPDFQVRFRERAPAWVKMLPLILNTAPASRCGLLPRIKGRNPKAPCEATRAGPASLDTYIPFQTGIGQLLDAARQEDVPQHIAAALVQLIACHSESRRLGQGWRNVLRNLRRRPGSDSPAGTGAAWLCVP